MSLEQEAKNIKKSSNQTLRILTLLRRYKNSDRDKSRRFKLIQSCVERKKRLRTIVEIEKRKEKRAELRQEHRKDKIDQKRRKERMRRRKGKALPIILIKKNIGYL